MAKEVAIKKRAKISQAQQYVLLAVVGASLILGASISIIVHLIQQISFNAKVIAREEQAIVDYSNAIKNIGVCESPKGSVYTEEELKKCNPDSVDVSSIPNTLRANILENLAANTALNSVPKESTSECVNPTTGKNFTYKEMSDIYKKANTEDEMILADTLIQSCSALRIIPDALPAFKNEAALLSGLNKIFYITGIEPESLSPTGDTNSSGFGTNLDMISVRLSVESDSETTIKFLSNVERSIREFDVKTATIEWGSNNTLLLNAQAAAYYMEPSTLVEITTTINPGDKK